MPNLLHKTKNQQESSSKQALASGQTMKYEEKRAGLIWFDSEFYGPVNTVKLISILSFNLLPLFLGRLSPLSGSKPVLCAQIFVRKWQLPLKGQEKHLISE